MTTHKPEQPNDSSEDGHFEEVEIAGHIIDSLILPKVLDTITASGGSFRIQRITVGQARSDPSYALVEVRAGSAELLTRILAQIADHGAVPTTTQDCRLVPADMDGAFPEGFYSTTNQRTEVRLGGEWVELADQEMDCGVVVEGAVVEAAWGREQGAESKDQESAQLPVPRPSLPAPTARCIPMIDVKRGMQILLGHAGVRVYPQDRGEVRPHDFAFMSSGVSTEKPKGALIRDIARELVVTKRKGGKSLLVGGPAIVHTGSGPLICKLIERGYIHKLFAGNALATHDIEQSLYGTSLGVHLDDASIADAGHEHHLRAINRIRRCGSIRQAVEQGVLTSGIMHACIEHNVDFLLAGSIRDDGPLPDVITDVLVAQAEMRAKIKDVDYCLMIATMLHSVAVGNLLPARIKVVCVDINPSTVIKLSDRGSFQTVGLVTDVEPFLRALTQEIDALEGG